MIVSAAFAVRALIEDETHSDQNSVSIAGGDVRPAVVCRQRFPSVGRITGQRLRRAIGKSRTVDQSIDRQRTCLFGNYRRDGSGQTACPAQEDAELDGQTIRTNNAWLHDAVNLVIKNAYGDEEQIARC